MVVINEEYTLHTKLKKVRADYDAIKNFRTEKFPALPKAIVEPIAPTAFLNASLTQPAAIVGIPEVMMDAYMRLALFSDHPAIQHKLKELIAITKLVSDAEEPLVVQAKRIHGQYEKNLNETREINRKRNEEYSLAYKQAELIYMKMRQDFDFYAEDLLTAIFNWINTTEGVWQTITKQALIELYEYNGTNEVEIIERFKTEQTGDRYDLFFTIRRNHSEWIQAVYQELISDYVEENQEEFFHRYHQFDEFETEDTDLEYEYDNEYERLRITEDLLIEEAKRNAVDELRARYYSGADGYDDIYRDYLY